VKRLSLLALLLIPGCEDGDGFPAVSFPDDFLWGTASAAYQVEGTSDPVMGTVPSNWQEWEELDNIKDGQRNPEGSGFYTLYDQDFEKAEALGTNAYRLGLEWARIEPTPGNFNQHAIDHYREVILAARAHGLEPIVTLYHWVVPPWVQSPASGVDLLGEPPTSEEVGGKTVLRSAFADAITPYAAEMAWQLGDLVDIWVVLNEPYTVLLQGYLTGQNPNGKFLDVIGMRNAALNFIIAYASAYDAVKANDPDSRVGNAAVGSAAKPASPTDPDDASAAERINYLVNDWMTIAWTSGDLDVNIDQDISDSDGPLPEGNYLEQLGGRLDYVGLNYYSTLSVVHCPGLPDMVDSDPQAAALASNLLALPKPIGKPGTPFSENGLEIDAPGMLETLRIYGGYADESRPIFIMENGHGDCDDDQRPRFITEHLYQVGLAINEGIPVAGYMLWSLTDNFEWADGRDHCFGIYKVDYDNDFARTATLTVPLYERIIAEGKIGKSLYEEYTSVPYPSDCLSIEDRNERQACIDSNPNPLSGLQELFESICTD
jgi:beta-glucosidase/6-phospho-beta-glucosidase/beta-galactosidase